MPSSVQHVTMRGEKAQTRPLSNRNTCASRCTLTVRKGKTDKRYTCNVNKTGNIT